MMFKIALYFRTNKVHFQGALVRGRLKFETAGRLFRLRLFPAHCDKTNQEVLFICKFLFT